MGFHIRYSDNGIDIVTVTEKGIRNGFPRGVIIPAGYTRYRDIKNYMKKSGHNIYTAKHLIDADEFTHLKEKGIFNVFGYYLTDEDVISQDKNWCMDVKYEGMFRQITVDDVSEIERYIA